VTVADAHVAHARRIVVLAALATCAAILVLTHGFTFYFDEWDFILSAPDWTLTSYLQAHNEHPVILARLIYAALLSTVGLRSYLPYMAILLALHATNVVLLFEVVRRRAGDLAGIAAAGLVLVLGAGWENLLWAFQITFVGSVACGLGMLLMLQAPRGRRRMMAAAALLTGSLMFSGIGLFFGVAAVVQLALTPGRRRDLLWLSPVAVALGAWYLAYGHSGTAPTPQSGATDIAQLPLYVLWGLGSGAAGVIGMSGSVALPMLALATAAVALTWYRQRPDPFALGVAAALVSFYAVTGASRIQLGYEQSGSGRYVYEGAILWILLLAGGARLLPWRGTWRPALGALLFLACFNSVVVLYTWGYARSFEMDRAVADLQALASVRNSRCLDPNGAVDKLVMPQITTPAAYYRAVDRFGDPVAGRPVPDFASYAVARRNLISGGCS
jgi:hypothetical protein